MISKLQNPGMYHVPGIPALKRWRQNIFLIQGWPELYNKFQASLNYITKYYLNNITINTNRLEKKVKIITLRGKNLSKITVL